MSLYIPAASSYELATHAALTKAAFDRSQLETSSDFLIQRLGFLELLNVRQKLRPSSDIFGKRFFEFDALSVVERAANPRPPLDFEFRVLESAKIPSIYSFTLGGWLTLGAVREDDVPWNFFSRENNPQDDLCEEFIRPCYRVIHHFFDPYNNRSLTVPVIPLNSERSPDWAVGTLDAFQTGVQPKGGRNNRFSMFDAREAMYRAMTLRRKDPGSATFFDLFPQDGTAEEKRNVQMAYWATAFRALGGVVHHLQDMAQPQHTRNDAHAGDNYDGGLLSGIIGHKSFYENYVDFRISGLDFKWGNGNNARLPLLDVEALPAYPIPAFNTYAEYWSSSVGIGSLNGKGMADYSSRGFYSAGTNIGSPAGAAYPRPPQAVSLESFTTLADPVDMFGRPLTGTTLKVYERPVMDTVTGQPSAPAKLSSHGAFDQFLVESGKAPAFTLNKYNYDAQIELLLPRAIAYSAGLMDYFFRGKLKIGLPGEGVYAAQDFSIFNKENPGFRTIAATVHNVTAPISGTAQNTDAQGTLVAVLRYRLNTCLTDSLISMAGSPRYNPNEPEVPIWDESCRHPPLRTKPPIPTPENPTPIPDEKGTLPLITVSSPIPMADLGSIDGQTPLLVKFQFPKALPFNAIDVDLQVIYRGPLGSETDGIAVGFQHLSEPTFYNFVNDRDCEGCAVGECKQSSTVGLPMPRGNDRQSATVLDLPAGHYARVGFIGHPTAEALDGDQQKMRIVNNQDFPADTPIVDPITEAVVETWPPAVKMTGRLFESRAISAHGAMFSWMTGNCDTFGCHQLMAQRCAGKLLNAVPHPVIVHFP